MKYKFNELKIDEWVEFDCKDDKDYRRINQAVMRARLYDDKLNLGVKTIGDKIRVTRYKNI